MANRPALAAFGSRFWTLLWTGVFVVSLGLQYAQTASPAFQPVAGTCPTGSAVDGLCQVLGNFEVDGNLTSGDMGSSTTFDWAQGSSGVGLLTAPTIVDPIGNSDTSVFSNGGKESDNPTTWQANGSSGQGGKDDIGNVYVATRHVGTADFLYLGIERDSNNGTTFFDFEFNQRPNINNTPASGNPTISVPGRSPGDLLLTAEQQGNGTFSISATISTWSCTNNTSPQTCDASGSWSSPVPVPPTDFFGLANDSAIAPAFSKDDIAAGAKDGLIPSDQFAEMALNLTAAQVSLSCPGFGNLNVRSVASNSGTAELKDFTNPAPLDLSNCGGITWEKQDNTGTDLGGATFTVTPNPYTGTGSLTVVDNTGQNGYSGADTNPAPGLFALDNVPAGTYQVQETVAPIGYILDGTSHPVTVDPFVTAALSYVWKNPPKETPTLTTAVSSSTANVGDQVTDLATLTGTQGPTSGSVSFYVCGPTQSAAACASTSTPVTGNPVPVSTTSNGGTATSGAVTLSQAGYYCFYASYTPDTTASAVYNGATHSDASTECVQALPANLTLTKVADQTTVSAGDPDGIGFTVTLTNTGPGTAYGVKVNDPLPTNAGLAWTIDSQSPANSWSIGGTTLSFGGANGVSLASGASASVHIASPTTAATCGSVNNSASASSSNDGSPTAQASITVQCPDVTIAKTTSTGTVSAGDPISYTVTVHNAGPATAYGVSASDTLPTNGGLAWTIAAPVTGWSLSNGILTYSASSLASGASSSVAVTSPTTAATCGVVSNSASVAAGNEPAGAQGNDTVGPVTITVQCPTLTLQKTSSVSAVSAGQSIGFTVTFGNSGPGAAYGASVNDPLPGGSDLAWSLVTPVTGWSITGSPGSQTLAFSGDLASGQSTSVTVVSNTTKADCELISNTATGTSTNDPSSAPIQASANTTVQCGALLLTKDAGSTIVNAGSPISYSVTVTNTGAGTISNASVSDTLPTNAGLSWTIPNPVSGWTISNGVLSFTATSFGPSATSTVTITSPTTAATCGIVANSASAGGDQTSTVTVGPVTITVNCPNVTIAKTTSTPVVNAGQAIGFTVSAHNAGPGDATGVAVSDPLPGGSGVSWSVLGSVTGWSLTGSAPNQTLTFNGNLAAGATTSVTITSPTTLASCKVYDNTATATATNNPGSIPSASASATVNCPTIVVTKSVDATVAPPGDVLHYALKVSNTGAGDASGVNVSDDISSLLAYATYDGDASNGGTFSSPTLSWTGLSIPSGRYLSLTFSVTLNQSGFPVGTTILPNTVVVTGLANNCGDASTDPACSTTTTVTIVPLPSTPASPTPAKTLPNTATLTGTGGPSSGTPLLPLVLMTLAGLAIAVRFVLPAPMVAEEPRSQRGGRHAPRDPFRFRGH